MLERWRREGLPEGANYAEVCGLDDDFRHRMPGNGFLCPPFMLERGRYVPAVEDFVRSNVSWDNHRYFCDTLRDLIHRYRPSPSV
jgi:hypothetical protein